MLAESAKAFKESSKELKNLGGSAFTAAQTLLDKMDDGEFTDLTKLGGKDVSAVIGPMADRVKKGAKMAVEGMDLMLDKIKDPSGWGATSQWDSSRFEEAAPLLPGLDVADINAIKDELFDDVMSDFGSSFTFDPAQEAALGAKLIKQMGGDMAKATADKLTQAKGFFAGLPAADLGKIPPNEFKKAAKTLSESAQKIGAFAADQLDAIETQIEAAYPAIDTWTEDIADELGGFLGAMDIDDLVKIPTAAVKKIKGAAVKMMGGAKAVASFTKEKLAEFPDEAKAAFNGDMLQDLKADAEKLKAVVCDKSGKCPGAITDFVVDHTGVETDATILAKFKKQFVKIPTTNIKIQQAATPKATTGRRRMRALSTSKSNTQTVVRAETSTNGAAADVANAGASLGKASTVSVTAQDKNEGVDMKVGGASSTAPGILALALVMVVALRM
jgi:hypothetical protein